MKLHLGVIDVPYVDKPGRKGTGVTTGDVATFLEEDFHPIETFVKVRGKDIGESIERSVGGALETLMMGGPTNVDPFGTATNEIKQHFNDFILRKEMDNLGIPGVPTQASLKGVNSRRKNRKGKPGRPSFYDSGLYLDSFVAWVT